MKQALMFLAAGVLSLAACSGAEQPAGDLPSAPGVLFRPEPGLSCDWRGARDFANGYFSLNGDRQTAATLLRDAERAEVGSQVRNDLLFELFQLVASARGLGNVKSGGESSGGSLVAVLVKDYPAAGVDCGAFTVSHNDAQLPDVLKEALDNGGFAYRDGEEGYVRTEDGGAALWTENWSAWIGGRAMVFGASWPTSFGNEALVGTFSYRFGLIYDDFDDNDATGGPTGNGNDDIAIVELCEENVDPPVIYGPTHRVGRVSVSGAKTALQIGQQPGELEEGIKGFCPDTPPAPGGFAMRVLRGIVGFFAPTPLQAKRRAPPGRSGGIDDLSDFIGVDAVAVQLHFDTQPGNGPATEPFLVEVHAGTAGGNDFEDVPIILSIAGNQGAPAGATLSRVDGCGLPPVLPPEILDPNDLTEETDEEGIASFCVMVNKNGGYTLQAEHGLTPDFAATVVVSNSFNRTPGQ